MPLVPQLAGNQQTLRPLTNERFNAPDVGAGGREIGRAIEGFGGAVRDAANDEQQIHTTFAEARAKDLDNQYQQFERETLYGDQGYYSQLNADALSARPSVEDALRKKRAELIAKTQDHLERGMLEQVLDRRTNESFDGIARYAQGQLKQYGILQSGMRLTKASEAYARDPEGPQAAANRQTVLSETAALADLNGWQGDVLTQKREEALTGMHSDTIESMMIGDPAKAAAYLEKNRSEINAGKAFDFDRRLQPLLVEHDAKGFADLAENYDAPLSQPVIEHDPEDPTAAPRRSSNDLSAVWGNMIHTESRGRQSAVSPKGAIGIAQVMPATAREMAGELGIPFDDNRYRNDAGYNETLGKAYFAKMMRTFGGDVRKAVAAYNAGPRGVRNALRAGDDWEAHLPKETRGYLQSVLGGSRGVAVGRDHSMSTETDAENDLAGQIKWAETIIPERLVGKPPRYIEQVVKATKAEITDRYQSRMIGVRAHNDAVKEDLYEQAFDLGDGFTDISQLRGANAAPVEVRFSLRNMADSNRAAQAAAAKGADNQTDQGFYAGLSDAYASDPAAFLAIEPSVALSRLSKSDYQTYVGWRQQALKDRRTGHTSPPRTTAQQIIAASTTSLNAAGLSISQASGTRAKAAMGGKQAEFTNAMMRWAGQFRTGNHREPDAEEIRKQADRYLVHMAVGGSEVFAFEAPTKDANGRVLQGTVVVPREIDRRIRKSAPNATDAEVRQIYVQGRGVHW